VSDLQDPLVSPFPVEVPLTNAPLVRVIAQVRFPEILSIEQREFVAPFQESIRTTYPILRQEQVQSFALTAGGPPVIKNQVAWRFSDVAGGWRVSLTPDFLALETTKYANRSDFFRRFREVAEALGEHVEPGQVDRIGVRYIDRILGAAVGELASLVRPEVRGISGTIAAAHAVLAVSESVFERDGARVVARWGHLPPGATVDPAALEPVDEKSWILDLDMSSEAPIPFAVDRVVTAAESYAKRIYAIFRWAVTDAFLVRYGGKP
jgi:uncharacterized protein (TIGR04255 family)